MKKKKQFNDDLQAMIKEKKMLEDQNRYGISEEKLREMSGQIGEIQKLILQETSPSKHSSAGKGIVNDFAGNQNTLAHKKKVKQLQARIEKYQKTLDGVEVRDMSLARPRGSAQKGGSLSANKESKGIADLFEKQDRRTIGMQLCQRQIELENLKGMAYKDNKKVAAKQRKVE